MFQLLIAVPLDSLEQRRQGLLLFLPEERFLALDCVFEPEPHLVFVLLLFHLLALDLEEFSLFVPLHEHQLAHFVFKLHKATGELGLVLELRLQLLVQLLDLQSVLFLELLERQVGSCFIVGHVVVPRAGELQELGALCRLHSD